MLARLAAARSRARASAASTGRRGYNVALLAVVVPSILVVWVLVGELLGDVWQADGDGIFVHVLSSVVSVLYISLVFYALFLPGLALFLMACRTLRRHSRLFRRHGRVTAVALSPLIAIVFFVIRAVPEDRQGVVSGWWYILSTAVTVGLLARLPRVRRPTTFRSA